MHFKEENHTSLYSFGVSSVLSKTHGLILPLGARHLLIQFHFLFQCPTLPLPEHARLYGGSQRRTGEEAFFQLIGCNVFSK